jgi:alkylation response protein AidB-like acyl-CoA dehydrogenase
MFEADQYTMEQKIIKDFINQLARDFDFLYFLENMKKEEFPEKFWKAISEGGYIGILVPEEYSGTNFKARDLVLFCYNMALKGLMSLQLINQIACCDFLAKFGSKEQKKRYLSELISGKLCGYALMEENEGMSLFDINTKAIKKGTNYKLNGQKNYVVGAKKSSKMIVAARTKAIGKGDKKTGISLFIVDSDANGIEIIPKEINVRVTPEKELMMITGDTFSQVNFSEVNVSGENLLGEKNCGGEYIQETSNLLMLMTAACAIGWAENVLDKAVEYAKKRVIFEEPIGSYQAVQHPMVRAKTDIELAKLALDRAVSAYDNKEDIDEVFVYASISKYAATEAAYNACDISIQAHGGYSFDRETGIITLWPLILLSRIIPLNNDIILEKFSEAALGLPLSID